MMARIMQNINALCERIFLNGKHSLRRVPRIFRLGFPFKVFKSVMVGVLQVSLPRAEVLYRFCSLYLPFLTHYHSVRCTRTCCPLTGLTWKVKMTLKLGELSRNVGGRCTRTCHFQLFTTICTSKSSSVYAFLSAKQNTRSHEMQCCDFSARERSERTIERFTQKPSEARPCN